MNFLASACAGAPGMSYKMNLLAFVTINSFCVFRQVSLCAWEVLYTGNSADNFFLNLEQLKPAIF